MPIHLRLSAALTALALVCHPGPAVSATFAIVDHDLQATIAPGIVQYLQRLHRSGQDGGPAPTVTMRDLSPANRSACLDLARQALAVYPDQLLDALVPTLALADDIEVWGTLVGGVQGPRVIGINCLPAERPIVPQVIHGAIAGKVLDLAPPDWTEWEEANPSGFTYGNPAAFRDALARPDAALTDRTLNTAGFVSRIGLSVRQADFQTYAEQVFLDGPAFAAAVHANPAMRLKLGLTLRSYLSVAPSLQAYFTRTGLAAAADEAR